MRSTGKVFLKILKGTGVFLSALLCFQLVLYFLSPVYDFPPAQPFSGERIYHDCINLFFPATRFNELGLAFQTTLFHVRHGAFHLLLEFRGKIA